MLQLPGAARVGEVSQSQRLPVSNPHPALAVGGDGAHCGVPQTIFDGKIFCTLAFEHQHAGAGGQPHAALGIEGAIEDHGVRLPWQRHRFEGRLRSAAPVRSGCAENPQAAFAVEREPANALQPRLEILNLGAAALNLFQGTAGVAGPDGSVRRRDKAVNGRALLKELECA